MNFLRGALKGNVVESAKAASVAAASASNQVWDTLDGAVGEEYTSKGRIAAAMKRLRPRTVLFVPGSNAKAMKKAESLPVDAIILDLEDAVKPSQKFEARDRIANSLSEGALANKKVIVRINSPRTAPQWGFLDLDMCGALKNKIHGVAIPKVEPGDEKVVQENTHPDHKLWGFIETPRGVLKANEICETGAFEAIALGSNDLGAELRLPIISAFASSSSSPPPPGVSAPPDSSSSSADDREPALSHSPVASTAAGSPGGVSKRFGLFASMSLVVLAARANNIAVLDGVYNDFNDGAGFSAECVEGKLVGFDGKTLIHPSQIDMCRRVFSATAEELEWAKRILQEVDENPEAVGTIQIEGKQVEEMHIRRAADIIAGEQVASELERISAEAIKVQHKEEKMFRKNSTPKRQSERDFNYHKNVRYPRVDAGDTAPMARMPPR